MINLRRLIAAILLFCAGLHVSIARAESQLEEGFQDMFVTAGYSAAAGAAIGAAILTLQDEPGKHLKFISIGASVGFLGGTLFGGWIALAPLLVDHSSSAGPGLLLAGRPTQIIVRPWINTSKRAVTGIEVGSVLSAF